MSRTHHRATVLGAALTVILTLSACGGGEGRQQEYLERAQGHLEAGNYDKAKVDIKNVLQINPNNAEAYYLMALVEEREQNWQPMFGNLSKAVELVPAHLEANIKLGQMYIMSGEMEKAKEQADMVFGLAPEDPGVLGLMAALKFREENREQAEKYALQALKADPGREYALSVLVALYLEERAQDLLPFIEQGRSANPGSLSIRLQKIQALKALEKQDEVVAEYQQLIELYPEDLSFLGALAEYYVAKERLAEAEELLRAQVKSEPDSIERKMLLARFLLMNQSPEAAVAELETMLKQDPENMELRNALGGQLAAMGETDRAEAVFKQTFEFDLKGDGAQTARNQLAQLGLSRKDYEQAKRWNAEALEIEPENPEALTTRARLNMIDGDYAAAIPDLRLALRASPESVPTLLLLSEAQQRERAINLALDNYRAVLRLQPDNLIALYQSAAILAGQENYTEAEANIERILAAQPGNVPAINLLVEILSRQQRWDDAQLLVDRLAADEKTAGMSDMMTAVLELRQGNHDRAIELAKGALAQDEQLTTAVTVAAQAYASKGDLEGGISFVKGHLAAHPENGEVYDILAQLYVANKQYKEAIAAYEKAIELAPQRVQSYIGLANLHHSTGSPEAIIGLYERGIAANPENGMLKSELAVQYQLAGDNEKALALLEEAYALDPKSEIVRNNMAGLLIDYFPTELNLRRAQELTSGFEESGNPALIDTLGWLQYKQGNIPQAINLLVAAQKAGGEGPDYWYHLGMAYAKNGQADLAKEQLAKVLAEEYAGYGARAEAQKTYDSL